MDQNNKINTAEGLIMIMVAVLMDGIDLVLALLLIGEIADSLLDVLDFSTLGFWYKMRGISNTANMVTSVIKFIPIINAFPERTIGTVATIVMHNNPKLAKGAQIAAGKITTQRS